MEKEINRIKAVLAEVGKTNLWWRNSLVSTRRPCRNGVQTLASQACIPYPE